MVRYAFRALQATSHPTCALRGLQGTTVRRLHARRTSRGEPIRQAPTFRFCSRDKKSTARPAGTDVICPCGTSAQSTVGARRLHIPGRYRVSRVEQPPPQWRAGNGGRRCAGRVLPVGTAQHQDTAACRRCGGSQWHVHVASARAPPLTDWDPWSFNRVRRNQKGERAVLPRPRGWRELAATARSTALRRTPQQRDATPPLATQTAPKGLGYLEASTLERLTLDQRTRR